MKRFIAVAVLAVAATTASALPIEQRRAVGVYCDATITSPNYSHIQLDPDTLQFCESLRGDIAASSIINEHFNGVGDNVWTSASVLVTRGSLDKPIHVNISCKHCSDDDELNIDIRPQPAAVEPARSDWYKLSEDARSVESAMEGFAIKH